MVGEVFFRMLNLLVSDLKELLFEFLVWFEVFGWIKLFILVVIVVVIVVFEYLVFVLLVLGMVL